MTDQIHTPIAGVTFAPDYPENLLRIHEVERDGIDGEGVACVLVREPDNQFDSNAIAVHCPATGGIVGHVPRNLARKLAPRLDGGERSTVSTEIRLHPDHADQPGADAHIVLHGVEAAATSPDLDAQLEEALLDGADGQDRYGSLG